MSRQVVKPTEADLKQNALLAGLNPSLADDVMESGKVVILETPDPIYAAGCQIRDAYFPIDAVLSVVTHMTDGASIEVGTVGREGVSAIPLLLGATTSANESYCQVPGRAVVISSEHFRRLLTIGNSEFRRVLNRFLQAYVNMLGQLAACNGRHSVYERCARWLLLTHDRVNSDRISLTHEYLSMMLGARRSGVTAAAAALQFEGLISYSRGHIDILDRAGLEAATCECYAVAREQFGPLLGMIELSAQRRA
ncbi:MAG: Crp/Fnr family transcriptional regulator [Candidatus Cybelea sp.]|jgi:CRP-like cAMP-binding protein